MVNAGRDASQIKVSPMEETMEKLSFSANRYLSLVESATKAFGGVLRESPQTSKPTDGKSDCVDAKSDSDAPLINSLISEIVKINRASEELERLISRSVL